MGLVYWTFTLCGKSNNLRSLVNGYITVNFLAVTTLFFCLYFGFLFNFCTKKTQKHVYIFKLFYLKKM